jgi:hypothetical protein
VEGGALMAPAIRIAKSGARNAPTLPADAITRTFGIFGMKDSGKTNTARVVVEGICKIGGHAIVFDPVGVWWGATRAGEGPGIPGVVIGGEHADVPLEETGGQLIAELALARAYQLIVVDLNLLRKGAKRRFMADCLEELYHGNRLPLSVVFEEADQTLPQTPRGMDPVLGRVLGAAEDIVKLGRSRGLGGIIISQRLATVIKNVTEQIENLILGRLVGPNDRKAVKEWVESNGDPEETREVMNTIAKLEQGEAWMYSPGWLKLLERIRVRHARTLDSSATPTSEELQAQESAKRAPVSLDTLRAQMQETIERTKANDPVELRKRIEELERELQRAGEHEAAEPEKLIVPDATVVRELELLQDTLSERAEFFEAGRVKMQATIEDWETRARNVLAGMEAQAEQAQEALSGVARVLDGVAGLSAEGRPAQRTDRPSVVVPAKLTPPAPPASNGASPANISGPQQRLLDTLAWFLAIGVAAPRRAPLAALAGVSSKSSGFRANLSALSSAGLIAYPDRGRVSLTGTGELQANRPERPGTEAELQEAIMRMVSGPQAALLRELIAAYPGAVEREELAGRTGVSPSSSGYRANLSALSSLELACYPQRGYVAATDLLFLRR